MDLTDVTGPFGNFQKKILFGILLRPICWSFIMINYQFINQRVNFTCSQSGNDLAEFQPDNISLEFDNSCERYPTSGELASDQILDVNSTIKCDAFVYDTNKTYTTITEEWDLVCSREWMISFGYMCFSLGNFVAYIPAGQLADKIGRKPLMLVGQGAMTIISIVISFTNSMPLFLTLRFLIGCSFGLIQNPFMAAYVESVGPEYRDYIVYSFSAMWGVGTMLVAFLAWIFQEWRTLVLVSSIPFQLPLLLIIYWLVPESTRWLITTKRYARAEKQLISQAKMNGKEIEDIKPIMDRLKAKIELDRDSEKASFIDVFKNRHLRKTAAILYVSFIATVFINHGFTLSIGLEGGSIYLNLFLSGAAEVPVVFFYYMTIKYFNRRQGLLVSFVVTGLIFLAVIPISDDMLWLKLTFALLGRMTNSLAYVLIYIFANELFPTNLRAVAVSGAMTAGRIGSILCPFADVLGRFYDKNFPVILYGVLSLLTSAVFLLLPETQHKHLPDTVLDFEKLAKESDSNVVKVTDIQLNDKDEDD